MTVQPRPRSRRSTAAVPLATALALLLPALPAAATEPAVRAAAAPVPALAGLTPAQRVGQLFMVGVSAASGPSAADEQVLRDDAIGNVMLTGRSYSGTASVRSITSTLRSLTVHGRVAPFVATDQEGGYVQVLQGPGFSRMPTALTQGTYAAATLRSYAGTWGRQLAGAGVNLDLAPVMDTVPADNPTANQPVGRYYREYGYTPSAVAASGTAFLQGLAAAHVAATVKHFPGLGRATGNTDVTAGVTDPTRRGDPYLQPYAAGIRAGAPFVMVSTAIYPNIDPGRVAAFSPTVIGTVLRGDLGFGGVVISDDLANAASVRAVSPGTRAVDFFAAGGDMLLSVSSAPVPAMVAAVLHAAAGSPAFAARIDAAVRRVLAAKTAARLSPPTPGDFTGDGAADAAVFRPSNGRWYVRGLPSVPWGVSGDLPVAADFTGDGRADYAVFRPWVGRWYVRGLPSVPWGVRGDLPVRGDFTGDGRADYALFRPSDGRWYVRGLASVAYGRQGDLPVDGDFTGDGRADFAVFRPTTGTWYVRGLSPVRWGTRGDIPVAADYTGDGRADPAVFRPSTGRWYVRGLPAVSYGHLGDIPVPADYAGTGRAVPAVWRPVSGTWFLRGVGSFRFGAGEDVPVT